MKTFKNKNFVKRNYDCTNVVFCKAESAPDSNWIECDEDEIGDCDQLWIKGDVRYFGYL